MYVVKGHRSSSSNERRKSEELKLLSVMCSEGSSV